MTRGRKVGIWAGIIAATAGGLAVGLLVRRHKPIKPLILEGAVMRRASQADKELPLSDVEVTATDGLVVASGRSDSSGFFKLALPISRRPDAPVTLNFRRPGYLPLELPVTGGGRLYVAKMTPTAQQQAASLRGPQVTISNISVRYTMKTTTAVNVGSAVKTFQVVNTGNVPCQYEEPCSPDGRWKAATGSVSLDAGEGNIFRSVRVSCIAGPCPFTRITPQRLPSDVRTLKVTAYDWSDTATFLVEAEIFHPMENDEVRKSYPVIFGRVLDFTLPASAEGVCIEADVGGTPIVFPLGPDASLPWAECHDRVNADKTQVYRCELTPGYRF
jgi:hypothetical protein